MTGGAGFIGRNVTTRLLELGCAVRVLDVPGSNPPPGAEFVAGSVLDPEAVDAAVRSVDRILHLAALLGVERIASIPADVMRTNVEGTWNVLNAARKHGARRVVLASSSEVYGNAKCLPVSEQSDLSPVSIYGISKAAAEGYALAFHEQFRLPTVIVRYFNVYGPGQSERFVIPIFVSRALQNLSPIIYGHGSQSRCYLYVDDAVDGTLAALALDGIDGQVFNIGTDQPVSVLSLAEYICEISGHPALRPEYRPFGDGIRVERIEILQRVPDILKARSVLGFDYSVDWREGVARVIQHYDQKAHA